MGDNQDLFKGTIAEFMENGLDAELDEELGYSKKEMDGKYTIEQAVERLMPQRLTDQYAFLSAQSLEALLFARSELI